VVPEGSGGGLGEAKDILDPPHEHGIALVEVELEVTEEDDMAGLVRGEDAVQKLEGVERIGAQVYAPLFHIGEAFGGRPGEELALEGGAGGSDFGFRARLPGADDGESGVTGSQVGGEVHGDFRCWIVDFRIKAGR